MRSMREPTQLPRAASLKLPRACQSQSCPRFPAAWPVQLLTKTIEAPRAAGASRASHQASSRCNRSEGPLTAPDFRSSRWGTENPRESSFWGRTLSARLVAAAESASAPDASIPAHGPDRRKPVRRATGDEASKMCVDGRARPGEQEADGCDLSSHPRATVSL